MNMAVSGLLLYHREVSSEDELELAGNMFDALCCCLLVPTAKDAFVKVSCSHEHVK